MKCPHCKAEEQLPSPSGERGSVVTTKAGTTQHHACSLCGHGWATSAMKPSTESASQPAKADTEE